MDCHRRASIIGLFVLKYDLVKMMSRSEALVKMLAFMVTHDSYLTIKASCLKEYTEEQKRLDFEAKRSIAIKAKATREKMPRNVS